MLAHRTTSALVIAAMMLASCGSERSATPVPETSGEPVVVDDAALAAAEERATNAVEEAQEAADRAADAEARAVEAEERSAVAEERAAEAEAALAAAQRRVNRLKDKVADLTAEAETAVATPPATTASEPAPPPAPSDPYRIPSGVIDDGYHVGYLVDHGFERFSFDMAEILDDGSWKNVNPKIRTLPVASEVDYLYDAPPGVPIELAVENQYVVWVVANY